MWFPCKPAVRLEKTRDADVEERKKKGIDVSFIPGKHLPESRCLPSSFDNSFEAAIVL